jgi:ribulose-phosphate 3-epimerase
MFYNLLQAKVIFMFEVSPSILGVEQKKLREDLELLGNKVKEVHIDVMDGKFVKNNTLSEFHPRRIEWIKNDLNVHLMVEKPGNYFKRYWMAKTITFHVEAGEVEKNIKLVKQKKAIALNPETPVEKVYDYIDEVDEVLVMSVHPGLGGQNFIEETIEKIKKLRKQTDKTIAVDGGINNENAKRIVSAGANVLVVGTALFNGNVLQNFESIKKSVES